MKVKARIEKHFFPDERGFSDSHEKDSLKHLAGIHDAQRIERAFYSAHQLQLERRLVAKDRLPLELAQSMLGADRAAETRDAVVDDAVDRSRFPEECLGRGA